MIRELLLFAALTGSYIALAHEPAPEPSTPTLAQAQHDLAAVSEDWTLARQLAIALIADPHTPPLLADDMGDAVARGDEAAKAAPSGADDIELVVWRLWQCVVHVTNAALPKPAGA